MPIEIQYTEDKLGVVFCAVGKVTGQDILAKQNEIYQSDRFPRLRYWIVDRSRCTAYNVNADEVIQMAANDNQAAQINPNLLMALISENDLQFGVSRMFELQLDEERFDTMVFRSREAAHAWIKEKLNKEKLSF